MSPKKNNGSLFLRLFLGRRSDPKEKDEKVVKSRLSGQNNKQLDDVAIADVTGKMKLKPLSKSQSQMPMMVPSHSSKSNKLPTSNSLTARERELDTVRQQQRREIYALNRAMAELENDNFIRFCAENSIQLPLPGKKFVEK